MSFLVSNLNSYHNKFMEFWYSKTDITKWLYQFDISNRLSKMEEVFLIIFTIFKMCVSGKIHLSFTDNIPHVFNIKGIVPLVQAVPIFWHKVLMYMYIYRCLHLFHHITISNGRSQITRGQETTSPTWITIDVLKSEHYGAIFIALSQTVSDA